MASSKKTNKRMSFQDMEQMVTNLTAITTQQQSSIETLLTRITDAEKQVIQSNAKIQNLQHGLAISNLRAPSTIFHMESWRAHKAAITCIAHFGNLLLTGSTDKSLRVWDLADGIWTEIHTVRGHKAGICIIAPSGDLVATASGDLTVKLWDPRLGWNCVGTLESHENSVVGAICYIPSTKLLVTADRTGLMCVHDERGGFSCIVKRHTKAGGVLSMLLLNSSSKFLVTSHATGTLKIWDTNSNFLEMRCLNKSHAGPIHKILMWRDLLVSAGNNVLKLWDTNSWECVAVGKGHGKAVYDLCTTSRSTCLAGVEDREALDLENSTDAEIASILCSVGADGKILFWDPLSMIKHQKEKKNTMQMQCVRSVPIPRKNEIKPQIITAGVFSPDGAILVLADRSAEVHIFSGFASIYLCEPNGTIANREEQEEDLDALLEDDTEDEKEEKEESTCKTPRK